ncbi:hypothetical protein niasHT_038384 [Heterodera trifolii]|uniref:Uncharacterized protein n=1 Tax=Heterodera trifolii TaxID=157864 RepID=A0ABD2IPU0_9BILA
MELLLFRHDEFDKLYGCEGFNADKIPLEQRTNILGLFISALETVILGIIGAVYCDYPLLIYTSGALGMTVWFVKTSAEMLLAINRCMELLRPQLAHAIFSVNKLRCLFALLICYGFAVAMFTKPLLFSGIYFSWFFNPYVGYTDDFEEIYSNTLHTTFLQVVIVSLFNSSCALIYISMQFVRISKIYIIVGTYSWVFSHGCPPLVYLLLNQRIRNDCVNFGHAIFRFLRNDNNNSVSNGQNAMAWMIPNYAGNNARNRNNINVPDQ